LDRNIIRYKHCVPDWIETLYGTNIVYLSGKKH